MRSFLRITFFLVLLQIIAVPLIAQNSLQIISPDWWYWNSGNIEEATLTIKPKGVYLEYGLYLTFGVIDPQYLAPDDSLEVELIFTLPSNSIVHDSWLWIEDEIIQAEIMDEWTAGQIYNEIVGRRMDPSILFKRDDYNSGFYYELRIFPILKNLPRKVKITYLVPTEWNHNRVSASLPVDILNTSYDNLDKFKVVYYPTEMWADPKIDGSDGLTFAAGSDTTFGDFQYIDIPGNKINNNLSFSVKSPMENGIFLGTYTEENENYYQLALLPSEILATETSKNVMLLFDYESNNSSTSKADIISKTKQSLLNYLSDTDSFNIAFSKLNIDRISDDWLPADSLTIEETFEDITESRLANYGNLPSLINNGLEFVNSKGGDGILVLIANTDDVMDPQPANQLIDDIVDAIQGNVTFHVADFQDRNINYIYIGNQYYEGNQYFYNNISRMTGGNFTRMRDGYNYSELMTKTFTGIGGFINTIDLYTRLSNGFCYGRYNINLLGSSAYLDVPIFQIGKFNGSGNFEIEINGVYDETVFSKSFTLTNDMVDQSDSTVRKMWVNKYINELEGQGSSNNIVSEIINASVTNRVLSTHTAFICLEPSQGGEVCYDCRDDGGGTVDVESDTLKVDYEFSVAAYPNPFNNQTKIKINLPSSITTEDVSFKIYNILGQVVRSFEIDQTIKGSFEFSWDGTNDFGQTVSSGIYIFVAISPQQTQSVKLQLLK